MPINMEGTRPLRGLPYPTFQCGQNVKIKNRACFDFDVDFNIPTA